MAPNNFLRQIRSALHSMESAPFEAVSAVDRRILLLARINDDLARLSSFNARIQTHAALLSVACQLVVERSRLLLSQDTRAGIARTISTSLFALRGFDLRACPSRLCTLHRLPAPRDGRLYRYCLAVRDLPRDQSGLSCSCIEPLRKRIRRHHALGCKLSGRTYPLTQRICIS